MVTWLHEADRDTLVVHPRHDPDRPPTGVFSTRSPDRPNPLGLHTARVLDVAGRRSAADVDPARTGAGVRIHLDALEAVDGTPVVDLEPVLARRHQER